MRDVGTALRDRRTIEDSLAELVLEFDANKQITGRRQQQIGQRGPNDRRRLAGLSLYSRQIVGPLCAVSGRLSETIARAMRSRHPMRLGHPLFKLPEHPDESCSQSNHDNQEHQCQRRRCEHVQHPPM
ncbi:hypothetical protein GWE18_06060 [Bradyrhizobium sp. CSA112]|uniref:hypothetical protein n=1 Tax=Bradyrhizobium sp. CSA112 TaxID=2699170 RepID=UPI0023B10FFE|nr:hypothetical protein [Bradyrhizobium sp. CSA112]MDE5452443.1 hypothetical protein [Bradyrhizobium sp. CSA112]